MDEKLDNAPNGYVVINEKGIIIETNNTFCSFVGYDKHELENNKFEIILDIAGKIFFQTHFFPMLKMQGKVDEIFLNLKTKKSVLLPVITSGISNDESEGNICICSFLPVPNRRKYEDEILAAKKKAQDALDENSELHRSRDEINKHSIELDKKIRELNRINDEVLQFNSIINHEMQECIRKILLFSKLGLEEKDETNYSRVIETANKLKRINSSLKQFIELDKHDFSMVDLNECLKDATTEAIKYCNFSSIVITGDALPKIQGSSANLKMLFFHLITNSIKFRKQDEVTINITSVVYKENVYKVFDKRYDYQEVLKIILTDDGQGFDKRHKENVFSILKKLDSNSAGNGIGLALAKKILSNHHGSITIDSTEGVGTSVSILIPIQQSKW